MGEAKRRQNQDPSFGSKPKAPPENPLAKRLKGMSKLDWGLWAVFLGSSVVLLSRAFGV